MTAIARPRPGKKFHRDPNALYCYKCGNDELNKLDISNDVVKRRRARRGEPNKTFDMVAIDCKKCGHQWYSMHKDAVKLSRRADKDFSNEHGGQK